MQNIPQKGEHGYTDAHKKAQLFKTFIFFLLPAVIFIVGYATSKTRLNMFTVVAVVGCLPACKELVNVIMFCRRRFHPAGSLCGTGASYRRDGTRLRAGSDHL